MGQTTVTSSMVYKLKKIGTFDVHIDNLVHCASVMADKLSLVLRRGHRHILLVLPHLHCCRVDLGPSTPIIVTVENKSARNFYLSNVGQLCSVSIPSYETKHELNMVLFG